MADRLGRGALAARTEGRRLVVMGVMGSIFLAALESTVVATAMPTIIASLGGLHIYSWVFSGFLLASTITMPLWGWLADQYGRRRTYLAGLVIFMAGSALSGLAQSMTQLVAFRALQGLGAGSLIPIGMTIVADLYGLERRARMQGYFSGVWGVASFVGPLLGGALADGVSWRWVFLINLPFGLLACAAIAVGLRNEPPPASRRASFDYAGMVLFAGAVSALLLGLVEGGRAGAWSEWSVVALLALSALLLVLFVRQEQRSLHPVVPLTLFRNPMVRAAAATGFLAGMAMFGAVTYVPLYLQAVLGSTATQAGFVLTPFILGWVAFSVAGARLVLRFGYRGVVIGGMSVLTVGFLCMTRWGPGLSRLEAAAEILVAGVGMGLIFVPLLLAVQNTVPHTLLGSATSMTTFFRAVGGAVGVAVMGAVMSYRLHQELGLLLDAAAEPLRGQLAQLVHQPDRIVHPLTRAAIPAEVVAAIRGALADALSGVFMVGFAVCVLALASAFLVPPGQARDLAAARQEPAAPPSP